MAVWEVVFNWVMDGTVAQNVLHYQDTSPASIDWILFADQITFDLAPDALSYLVPSIKFTGITVREDVPGSIGQTYPPTLGDLVGTSADDSYARVLALLVRKNAGGTLRPNRGRIYVPGVSSKHLDDVGEWSQNTRTAWSAFWQDMVSVAITTGGVFTMVIKASNPLAPNTVPYNVVTSTFAQRIPATQRRRRIGVGV